MPERVGVVREIAAEVEAVRRALRAVRPGAEPVGDGSYRFTDTDQVLADTTYNITARVADRDGRTVLTLDVSFDGHVPFFWWIFDPLIRRSARDRLNHLADAVGALASGGNSPPPPKRPWWAPPSAMTADQIRAIATLSLLLAVAEYGSSLLTQTLDFVAKTYGATNAQLGVVTATTRVGNLVVLVGGLLADRIGRRRLLLAAVTAVLVCTVLSAVAPTLVTYAALQVVVNGASNLAFLVAFVAAVEEAPEASRTYTLAIVGIASGLGFVLGAVLLPFADLGPGAWRGLYALSVIGFFFLPSVSRNLHETKRFTALLARHARRGRFSEVVDRRYGRRFAVLCVTGFLLNSFFAPHTQFTNRYLSDERGFSGLGILIVRAVAQAIPALAAAYIGGRLAESRGRRPMARWGLIAGASLNAGFFLTGGPMLWLFFGMGTIGIGLAGPSLSSFHTELFPTEVRGTAGAGLALTAVMGSATGLLLAGYLASPLGSIGRGVAVTAIGPLIVAALLIRFLPEAKGMLLDEVSPSEV